MRKIRKKRISSRHAENRKGSAIVEFAVVAPLMILLTMGMMELGRVIMVQQLLVNASREGARLAVLPDMTSDDVETLVDDNLATMNIDGATVSVSPENLSTTTAGTPVTVTITIPARDVSWVPNPTFTLNTTLTAITTMRKESQ